MILVTLTAIGLFLGQAGRQSYVDKGHLLRERNDLAGAEAEYKQALWFDAKNAPALAGMGMVNHLRGDLKAAVLSYRASLQSVEDQPEVRLFLADALQQLEDRDGALVEYRALATKLKKKSSQYHNNFGAALLAKGDVKQALVEFREAVALVRAPAVDGNAEKGLPPCVAEVFVPQFNLGAALAKSGDSAAALAQFNKATSTGSSREGYARLGRAFKATGSLDGAITNWSRALQVAEPECDQVQRGKPTSFLVADRQTMAVADIYFQLGNALQERGDLQRALVQFQKAQTVLSNADAVNESVLRQRIQALKDKLEPRTRNDEAGLNRTEPALRAPGLVWYAHSVSPARTTEVPSACTKITNTNVFVEAVGGGFRCVQKLRADAALDAELERELKANRKPGLTAQKRRERVLNSLNQTKTGATDCPSGWTYMLDFADSKQDVLERTCWRALTKADVCPEGSDYEPALRGCAKRQCDEGAEELDLGGTRGCLKCPAGTLDIKQTQTWAKKEGRKAVGLGLCRVVVNQ